MPQNIEDHRILDEAALNANTMSDPKLQAELFDLFFDQAPKYLDMLTQGEAENDLEAWRSGAHGVKGTARTLGLERLAETARIAEARAKPSEKWREQLVQELTAAQGAAKAYLAAVSVA